MHTRLLQYLLVLAVVVSGVLLSQKTFASSYSATHQKEFVIAPECLPAYDLTGINLPLESSPVSNDRDIPSENEQEDDFDASSFADQQTLFSVFDISTVRNWFIQPTSSIQNRISVPLFVLYHSWKDFVF